MEEKPKRQRSASYSRTKGHNYERKIIKELTELGFKGLKSSRSESKNLDNAKIDIAETEDKLPCYIQCKNTQNTPSVKNINEEVGYKDKPLAILWNIQEKKETNCVSLGEYAIIPKQLFYEFISLWKDINQNP